MSDINLTAATPERLRALANTDGAGKAHEEIRRTIDPDYGQWEDDTLPKWRVEVQSDAVEYGVVSISVVVHAEDAEAAKAIAVKKAEKGHFLGKPEFFSSSPRDIDVEGPWEAANVSER